MINRHRIWNLAADGALVAAAWYLAFQLRFDHGVPIYYRTLFERTIVLVVVINLVVFLAFGFYNRWWRYVSTRDMWVIARGVLVACLVADITVYFVSPVHNVRLPRSIAVLDFLLTLAFITGSRLRRPLDHRAPAGAKRDRARQGGDRRRRRRRRPADRARDASHACGRIHADRADRRRPAQAQSPARGDPRVRDDRRPAARAARQQARRDPDRDPLGAGRAAPARRRRRRRRAGEDAARAARADRRRRQPRAADPPDPGRGRAGPPARRGRPRLDRGVPRRRDRARDRRGRLDRLRALPPDRADRGRRASSSSTWPRPRCSRSSASSSTSAGSRPSRPSWPTSATAPRCARSSSGTRRGRLPRRRLQARAADGGEPDRVGAQQRARHEDDRRGRGRVRRRAVRARLDRQGRQPEDRDGPVEGGVRVDRRVARPSRRTSRPASSPCASATCSTRPGA